MGGERKAKLTLQYNHRITFPSDASFDLAGFSWYVVYLIP